VLVDANILLFAADRGSPFHARAAAWLTERLNGAVRVGLPWQSLMAFVRISTHPRGSPHPFGPDEAWGHVEAWLDAPTAWIPQPTERHREVVGALVISYQLRGNLITDAGLAALALEHGLTICSGDTDFARFQEIRWENPFATGSR